MPPEIDHGAHQRERNAGLAPNGVYDAGRGAGKRHIALHADFDELADCIEHSDARPNWTHCCGLDAPRGGQRRVAGRPAKSRFGNVRQPANRLAALPRRTMSFCHSGPGAGPVQFGFTKPSWILIPYSS